MAKARASLLVIVGSVGVVGAAAGLAVAQHAGSGRFAKSVAVVTATWIGPATGGLWSDPDNWDTAEFPNNGNGGVNYDVFITSPFNAPTVIDLDTDVVIESLFQRCTIDSQLVPANMTINGPWDWQGVILGPGTTTANGGITNPTSGIAGIDGGRILENAGLATALDFSIADGAQFNNLVDGTITIISGTLGNTNGGVINNFGMLNAESSLFIHGVFNNYGLVEVRGSLRLRSSGTHSGEFMVAEGAVLFIEPDTGTNDFTNTSNITGLGDVVFDGAEAINLSGGFGLSGLAMVRVPALNFTNAPTSPGFSLEVGPSFVPSAVVSFERGVPFLEELTLTSTGTLHIVGDAIVSGAVRWDGTMSGPGTTTTQGPIHAVFGLTLDGRTVIAEGGFLWQGSDFVLDNGAVFQNAEGSTFDINLRQPRPPSIITNTPKSPGRFVNAGIITQMESRRAKIMTDWQQTSTGVMEVYSVSFLGNTDISGSLTRLANGVHPLTFAGPDTGATITHRLNPDSTLTALHAVNVGDPNASGSDIINAEFAGAIDFSDPQASLNVYGANTTLALPLSSGGAATVAELNPFKKVAVIEKATLVLFDETVACCTSDGCKDTPAVLCSSHEAGSPGSTCEGTDCDSDVTCCFDVEPKCRVYFAPFARNQCFDADGVFAGYTAECDACIRRACCLPDSSCIVTSKPNCAEQGGDFQGENSTCGEVTCSAAQANAVAIEILDMNNATLLIHTPPDSPSSVVDVFFLRLFGTCNLIGPAIVDVGGVNFLNGDTMNFDAVDLTISGPLCEPGNVAFNLKNSASVTFDGVNCFADRGIEFRGSGEVHIIDCQFQIQNAYLGSPPGFTCDVPFHSQDSSFGPGGGDSDMVLKSGGSLAGLNFFRELDIELRGGVTFEALMEWFSKETEWRIEGPVVDQGGTIILDTSILEFQTDVDGLELRSDLVLIPDSILEVLPMDGSQPVVVTGSGTFRRLFTNGIPDDDPWGKMGGGPPYDDTLRADIDPGDNLDFPLTLAQSSSTGAQVMIGTLSLTGRDVLIANGSVLRVDIDPLAVGQRNDRFEIVATTTTFDASLRVSLAPGSECAVLNTDAFTILTGTEIIYPGGGDGRRIRTTDGVGSFVVNQSSTGIVLDGYAIAGDGNGDAAVNHADTEGFVPCLSGPADGVGAECGGYDFDGDGHADLKDFAVLQARFGTACP